ncbi:hypothetical protein G7085_02225 [Tessaracoccus sp. HDW20]|uniref:hypothetical protein n=1 Tax=Tessaracoccus coleopterorum TaxID=2714950 RepID=UPI0018D2A8C6|nr:hypothetical protein [Tessaracoccus coleopterorum]NHB83887.1 hypothetical protein [Tessaracoccus coleopterorum]
MTVAGVVTGNFQTGGFNGYFIQDTGDGLAETSDALFIYGASLANAPVGTRVRVTGTVSEFNGQTQLAPSSVRTIGSGEVTPPS